LATSQDTRDLTVPPDSGFPVRTDVGRAEPTVLRLVGFGLFTYGLTKIVRRSAMPSG